MNDLFLDENMNCHAYLIIVHKNLGQVQRLINILDKPYNDIYIHVDVKCKINNIGSYFHTRHSTLDVISVIDVKWGDYSMVECELKLLERATRKKHSYYHLLSGDDFPIKRPDEIYHFFENSGKNFVSIKNMKIEKEAMERVLYNHVCLGKFKTSKYYLVNKCYFILDRIGVIFQKVFHIKKRQKYPKYQRGSQWFSITEDFAKYILMQQNNIYEGFSNTFIPDELVIQTILINSEWKESLYAPFEYDQPIQNMRYIDWNRGKPYIFKSSDFEELLNSECMFARKFSVETDLKIITRLEKYLSE